VHSLALLCSGSDDDSCGGGTGTCAPGNGSHGGRRHTLGAGKVSKRWGVPVSAGREFDDSCLNAFLAAALLRVVGAVPIQAPASASVVCSAAVRGVDRGVSSGPDADGVG